MNLSDQLMAEMSRRNADYIAHYIGSDAILFKELVELVFKANPLLQMRASWVISIITDKYPDLLKPYIKKLVNQMDLFEHSGIRRNLLRYISSIDIPSPLEGRLYDLCFLYLNSRSEPPAVKVHCMQVLFNIAQKEPDLKNELRLVIEELINHESAAIKSRSRHLLSKL
jgi:hypothetical protein